MAYTYDLGGNRLTLSLNGTLFVSYAYDDASRLSSITKGASAFGFGYDNDNANRRTSITYPNGINTTYTYDNLNRLTRLKADLSSTPITDFQYLYDAAGNRTRKQQLDYTEDYSYDPLYRLTGVERSAGLTGINHYGYDAIGNRLTNQINDSVLTSAFNEKNQLTSSAGGGALKVRGTLNEPGTAKVNGNPARMLAGNVFEATIQATSGTNTFAVEATDQSGNITNKNYQVSVSATGATYTYDPNGNLTQKVEAGDTWVYEWNAENQLKRVLKNSVEQARFAYDPTGRRVEKVAGDMTTSWTHDGEDVLREIRGAQTMKYVHGQGVDQSLATDDGSALSYLHADGLGSVVKTTNAAGAVTLARRYDAWGNLELGATTSGYAFTGREWDSETGLYYYRARYYDQAQGRFLREDPLRFAAGPNFFAYALGNPVLNRDPYGLKVGAMVVRVPPRTVPSTVCGTDGCTLMSSETMRVSCHRKLGGKFGFDADLYVVLAQEFSMSPQVTSQESPWTTLGGHEDLHLQDFLDALGEERLNRRIRPEGFKSLEECQCAYKNFSSNVGDYFLEVSTDSHVLRDLSQSVGISIRTLR